MSKKDFIALADAIRGWNETVVKMPHLCQQPFTQAQINLLAAFCREQNSNFMQSRWLSYIAGECGKNGGKVAA